MSWDIHIRKPDCPTCGAEGEELFSGNYTHNTNAMMYRALEQCGATTPPGFRLYDLHGMTTEQVVQILAPPLHWWRESDFDVMADLEPSNRWGCAAGALRFWSAVVGACRDNPGQTIYVSG